MLFSVVSLEWLTFITSAPDLSVGRSEQREEDESLRWSVGPGLAREALRTYGPFWLCPSIYWAEDHWQRMTSWHRRTTRQATWAHGTLPNAMYGLSRFTRLNMDRFKKKGKPKSEIRRNAEIYISLYLY